MQVCAMGAMRVYLQAVHHGDGGDGLGHGAHALVEGVLGLVSADDGPGRSVVDHLFVGLFGTGRSLHTHRLNIN